MKRNLLIAAVSILAAFLLLVVISRAGEKPTNEMKISFDKGLIQWDDYTVDIQRKEMRKKGGKAFPISTDEQIGMLLQLMELADYADVSEEWYKRGGVYPEKKKQEVRQQETRM